MLSLRSVFSWVTALWVFFSLCGCEQKNPSYSYLMLHPNQLQQIYNQCVEQIVPATLPCETIMRAQADFTSLSNQREQDPERFGARVLQQQENTIYLKSKLTTAWQAYRLTAQSKSTLEELKKMRMEVDKRELEYKTSEEQVQTLLAVIAATSFGMN